MARRLQDHIDRFTFPGELIRILDGKDLDRCAVYNHLSVTSLNFAGECFVNRIILEKGDIVVVREHPLIYEDKVVIINGFVRTPGVYKIVDNVTTLHEIIEQAGGFLQEASLSDATLTRSIGIKEVDPEFERLKLIQRENMTDDEYDYLKSKSRQRIGKIVVDFVKLFSNNDRSEDIVLRKGDIIDIPEAKNYIIILGQAVNPGKVPFNEKYSVDDYISIAGGFGWRALESDVRVIKVNTGE